MVIMIIDKIFVSVYAITETKTTAAKSRISVRGSSYCFESNRSLLCGRDMKCHIKLQTECSRATMAACAMFESKSTIMIAYIMINEGLCLTVTHIYGYK